MNRENVVIQINEMLAKFFYPMQIEFYCITIKRREVFLGNIVGMVDKP